MADKQKFDLLIIGSGEAGKNLAWAMGKAGRRTAVVEPRLIGGSCPNIACMPSKNVIHSAKVAELARRSAEFGLKTGNISVDMTGVRARKRRMVDGDVHLHLELYKASGAELIMGEAHFVARKTVEVRLNEGKMRVLSGDQVVLNVGTHASFLKALINAETDQILGFTGFGTEAGEVLSVVQTAMLAKLPYTALRDAIFTHPTIAEGLTVLFDQVPARVENLVTNPRQGELAA